MFDMSVPWWEFVVRGVVVYLFLLFFLRISGRRQIGQYDPFDLIDRRTPTNSLPSGTATAPPGTA